MNCCTLSIHLRLYLIPSWLKTFLFPKKLFVTRHLLDVCQNANFIPGFFLENCQESAKFFIFMGPKTPKIPRAKKYTKIREIKLSEIIGKGKTK